jgi:hypothetical protein
MRYLCTVALSMAVLTGQPADSLVQKLKAEVARVRAEVAERMPADTRPALNEALARADHALATGRPALAIYELEQPWEMVSAQKFLDAHDKITTRDALIDLWKRMGEPAPAPPAARRLPAIAEAFAAATEARAPATYRASLSLGTDADVPSGVYYLGAASSYAEYAAFIRQLPWPQPASAPAFRSIAPELAELERTVASAYQTMDRSEHSSYVRADVTIKLARTLDEHNQYAAAMLEYLLARYRFASIHPPSGNVTPSRVRDRRNTLSAGRDDSIAQFFLDLTEAKLSSTNAADAGTPGIVLDDVLPSYTAALKPAAVTTAAAAGPQVTITLVRWPFT